MNCIPSRSLTASNALSSRSPAEKSNPSTGRCNITGWYCGPYASHGLPTDGAPSRMSISSAAVYGASVVVQMPPLKSAPGNWCRKYRLRSNKPVPSFCTSFDSDWFRMQWTTSFPR